RLAPASLARRRAPNCPRGRPADEKGSYLVVRLIRKGYAGQGFWKNVAVMMIVTLVTAAAHLRAIALWAVALLVVREISTFEKAFYYSAENYTALGYENVLSERWRFLGPLEAINGLLLFGLSTAVMFAVMSRLVKNRLRPGHLGGAAVNLRAGGSGSRGGTERPGGTRDGGGRAGHGNGPDETPAGERTPARAERCPADCKWVRNPALARIVVYSLKGLDIRPPLATVNLGTIQKEYEDAAKDAAGKDR